MEIVPIVWGISCTTLSYILLICLGIILKKFPELLPVDRPDWRVDWRFYWDHLRVAVPMALQFSVTGLGCVILQSAFNEFGSGTVAATTAAGRLEGLICIPFFAIGTTLAAYAAQNSGANNYRRILVGVRSGWLITAVISVLSSIGRNLPSSLISARIALAVSLFALE